MTKLAIRPFRSFSSSTKFKSHHSFVSLICFLLLFALVAISIKKSNAQTRPRRVGDSGSPTASAPSSTSPLRPPVLGGANTSGRSPGTENRQPSQDGPEEVGAGDVVRVNTTLVTIPVSVMDRDGKYIPNLRKEDFRIWDDGVEQQVAYFASAEQPFTVVLMIDTSGSTHFKLDEMQDAAIAFVNQLRPNDRVMVVSFDDKIRFLTDQPTNDHEAMRRAIMRTRTGGGTRLYDAVDQVINQQLNHIQGRKAIALFTDGVDTTSKHARYEDNVRDAEELDALIYPVEYDTSTDMSVWGPGSGGGGGQSSGNVVIDVIGAIFGGGSGNSRGNG